MLRHDSFTLRSAGGLLRVLQTACRVAAAFDPTSPPADPGFKEFQGIWDTGATGTVITQRVVDDCGLKPVGMVEVHGVNSKEMSETFLVNILLPNNLGVQQMLVVKGRIAGNADVLIGMDIITLGDFAITNMGGSTVFSFCTPSQRSFDFVAEFHARGGGTGVRGFRGFTPPKGPKPKHHK